MHFLWHSWFSLRRGISKNGSSTVFGRLAQICTMLTQLWPILKPGSSWHDMGAQAGKRAQTLVSSPSGWTQGESYGWWSTKTGDLGRSTRREAGKGWITVPPKAMQFLYSLGVYHISLCLHKVCMQPLQPKEKSVCHDITSVCKTRQSLGRVSQFPVFPVYCWFSITLLLDAPEKPQELPFL